ncbi:MAG: hypothetical protein KDB80_02120 [Planctomycetes bacterium]|nr:hypothetical protein [Planctomycetota bacterium]
MESSPTETLHQLEAIYRDGLEAVLQDDFARVRPLLDRADTLIATLPAPDADDADTATVRAAVREAWADMVSAVQNATEATKLEMASVRKQQRVTKAYGDSVGRPQTRHRAEA